ncbi:MAG: signal peptidase I [Clostridium sp.]|nr:signal peptidase I [Clostridium sp.]
MARINGLSFYKRRKKINRSHIKEFLSWFLAIAAAIFFALVLNYFFGLSTNVVGASMEPTLFHEQKVYIDRFSYILGRPKIGDVVVFLPGGNENSHYYCKRIVALPGDKVLIEDGILYVNGQESTQVTVKIVDGGIAKNEITLERSEYFCIGDNVNNSEDSRSTNLGPIHFEDIIGRAWFAMGTQEKSMGLISRIGAQ